jgi:mannose-6-phosphate isomerase
MWYILDAAPDAHLIAGLNRGVTRDQFSRDPAACVHRFPVRAGETVFIPSGRVHAIDAGVVIVEIQQNSDTTYRVYDWGRIGRQLHIEESLASIDFNDFEPSPTPLPIRCEYFHVERVEVAGDLPGNCDGSSFHVLTCTAGNVSLGSDSLKAGEFVLLPAALGAYNLTGHGTLLRTTVPAH